MTEVVTATARKGFPYLSANVWAELRSRFRASLPRQVTIDYLQSVLKVSEKAARNLHPQLRNIGLIDTDGVPTDLAKDFRDDEHYARACKAIIEAVYPHALLDAFPDPQSDLAGVAQWFMRTGDTGQAAGLAQARFFIMLAKGELPTSERPARRASAARAENGASRPAGAAPRKATAANGGPVPASAVPEAPAPSHSKADKPSLHIDVQVHIDANASLDQIDAIFASMAKHLYGK